MSIQYKILFSIELLSDYYRNGLCRDFTWEPAPDCIQQLQNYNLLLKPFGNTLLIVARTENNGLTIPLDNDIKWRFYLRLNSGNFYIYTNWNEKIGSGRKFWASNLSGNENIYDTQHDLLLTAPVAPHNNTAAYDRGDLVSSANIVYESILLNEPDGGNNKPVSNTDFWINTGSLRQFATERDAIAIAGNQYRVKLPAPVATVTTAFRAFNPATGNFDIVAKDDVVQYAAPGTIDTAVIDTSDLNPGRYRLTVNGVQHIVYIDPQLAADDCWGLVEVHHHTGLQAPFRLLDANTQELLSPRYKIRFRNRSTLWKYVLRSGNGDNKAVEDKDNPVAFEFEPPEGDTKAFMSTRPIPVTEQPRTNFHLIRQTGNNKKELLPILPNPRTDILREAARTLNGPKYYTSEIYLNI